MFGLGGFLCHEEDHETGWHEGHGHNDKDGDDHICALQSKRGPRSISGGGREHHGPVPPQLSRPHLQVIQGEASTGLVHGVVGDSDPCTQEGQC